MLDTGSRRLAQAALQGAGFVRPGLEGAYVSFRARLPSAGAVVLLIAGIVLLLVTDEEGGEDRDASRRGEPAGKSVDATCGPGRRWRHGADGASERRRLKGCASSGSTLRSPWRPGQPVECFGKKASRFTTGLIEGERVTLRFGEERRDVYDRLLAYVYLGDRFVNAELVRLGYARTLEIAPNVDYADKFARLQQAGGKRRLGLWGAC